MSALAFIGVAAVATLVRVVVTAEQPAAAIPWRTLAINTLGSLLLGLVFEHQWPNPSTVITLAGLGSLTTFSTVAAEVAGLLDDGRRRTAILYLGLTLVVGIAAARLGIELGARL